MNNFKLSSDKLTKKVEIEIENEDNVIYVTGRRNGVTIMDWVQRGEDVEETIERVKDQFENGDEH